MIADRELLDAREHDSARAIAQISSEFHDGFELVARIDRPAATVFGSARVDEHHPAYLAGRAVGRALARHGWATITGGGPGVMEAANRGAQEAGGLSVGFGIALPHEQRLNRYLDISYTFEHFYVRKVCFVKPAEGFIVLPGGFGTLDELFEALTLLQTEKIPRMPVVLVGSEHWAGLLSWIRAELVRGGMVSVVEEGLLTLTDDPEEAVEAVVGSYARSRALA